MKKRHHEACTHDGPKPKKKHIVNTPKTLITTHPSANMPVGIDEVGLGCIFSRVYCSAVVFPHDLVVPEGITIRDSKKMNEKKRLEAEAFIKENAIDWTVQYVTEQEIDSMGLGPARQHCWHKCLDALNAEFDFILVDGIVFKSYTRNGETVPHELIVKADDIYMQVAAASILAKSERDRYVRSLAVKYPELQERYGISKNVGYPTKQHKNGIKECGVSQFHRMTCKDCKNAKVNEVREVDKVHEETYEDIDWTLDTC